MYRYVLCSCMNMIRTLACSPAEYEVYINAVNSCVVYISFSLSLSPFSFNNSNSLQAPLLIPIAFRLLYCSHIAFRHIYHLQAHLSTFRFIYCLQARPILQAQRISYLSSLQAPLLQRNKRFLFVLFWKHTLQNTPRKKSSRRLCYPIPNHFISFEISQNVSKRRLFELASNTYLICSPVAPDLAKLCVNTQYRHGTTYKGQYSKYTIDNALASGRYLGIIPSYPGGHRIFCACLLAIGIPIFIHRGPSGGIWLYPPKSKNRVEK